MPEKTLVEIGDDCTLGERTTLQCHSLEDGAFKSDHIVIGSGCTLGTNGFVHYGVVIGDGVTLAPDSFLMKGERPRAGSAWAGNPARSLQV
jgi:non-ribosomal peptide synthetase-like protein